MNSKFLNGQINLFVIIELLKDWLVFILHINPHWCIRVFFLLKYQVKLTNHLVTKLFKFGFDISKIFVNLIVQLLCCQFVFINLSHWSHECLSTSFFNFFELLVVFSNELCIQVALLLNWAELFHSSVHFNSYVVNLISDLILQFLTPYL